ncbi:hypothetical protein ACFXPT_30755 [Streptomyces goshikiensis]|uniref:hypothetical protein n=1 Tax=Streptomyces goshikiensis TaxID=1942 RepID=UPI0036B12DA9
MRKITEAIGRPVTGKEGASAIETTRKTCERHVVQGRAVELEPGRFEIVSSGGRRAKGAA